MWNGPRTDAASAVQHFGLDEGHSTDKVSSFIKELNVVSENAFIETDENSFFPQSFFDSIGFGLDCYGGNIDILIQWMRVVKEPVEIDVMQKISSDAGEAFRSLVGKNWAERSEFEIAAQFQFECARRGNDMLAYTPVVASGKNALILHYIQNKQLMESGDLVLIDAGSYSNCYNTDVSRTIPVDGHFTDAQAELYQAVLEVQKRVIKV